MGQSEKKRRVFPAVIVVVVIAAILIALYFFVYLNNEHGDYIESTGVVEATEVALAPKISGRIEWLCCDEGDRVSAGAEAVRLENAELQARLEQGRARLVSAREAMKESQASFDAAVIAKQTATFDAAAFDSEIERIAALRDEAKKNLERAKALAEGGFIPLKDLDAAVATFDADSALYDSALARSRAAAERLKSAEAGIKVARTRISSARAMIDEASAEVRALDAAFSESVVRSPIDGVVAYKAFEKGEFVEPGGAVYTLYDLGEIWARVDIEETVIDKFALGARAQVRTPGSPGKVYTARVSEIGEVAGFATQRDVTRGRPDVKTFRVKAAVDGPKGLLKPGMTVEVRIYFTGAGG